MKCCISLFCSCGHIVMERQETFSCDSYRSCSNVVSIWSCGLYLCDSALSCFHHHYVNSLHLVCWCRYVWMVNPLLFPSYERKHIHTHSTETDSGFKFNQFSFYVHSTELDLDWLFIWHFAGHLQTFPKTY